MGHDLITLQDYDALNRASKLWLPVAYGSSDGSYDYDDGSSNGYYADGTPVGTDDPDYDTDQTRTIYRNSDGYPLVIYPNGDGTWCDDDGNTYDFANGEDVYDENGVDYYYHGEPAYVRYMPKNQ